MDEVQLELALEVVAIFITKELGGIAVGINVDLDILDEQGHGEDSLEEDDDNLYQDSDAALPEDAEERAIRRDQARQEDE